ncbi:MAG: HAL/PAL/TAL family ammonia-lyase [Bacteroidales bacterium]
MAISLSAKGINEDNIKEILFNKTPIEISISQKKVIENAYNFLKTYQVGKVIYGINTGFGPMAQYRIDDNDLNELQYNIIRSHSCGAGNSLPKEAVRGAMLSRICAFLQGKSAVHIETVEILVQFLNCDITPVVPEHGSVGASGDLVQLSHIALALIGEGEVLFEEEVVKTEVAMKKCGIKPLKMHIREGLALTNGTAMMTGLGFVNLIQARKLLNLAITASVLMNEIAASYDDFMSEVLNDLKLHSGQSTVAKIMREICASSQLLRNREQELYKPKNDEVIFKHKVQPYYSLRCTPQILGPILETINNTSKILFEELHSVDDNPIVDPENSCVYHGGNFHGDYVSFEMDKLKIAITKLTILIERQINYLFNDRINGMLPPFVNLGKLGLNYGLQACQFTATSTTAECQTLSFPNYVHSIPNNNDNQDVVSMGTNSALIANKVIENSFQVMSVHFMAIVHAVEYLKIEGKLSEHTAKFYKELKKVYQPTTKDTAKHKDIARVEEFLRAIDLYASK